MNLIKPIVFTLVLLSTTYCYAQSEKQVAQLAHELDNFDESDKQAVLGWYKSPLGQKITQLESNPDDTSGIQLFLASLKSNPPSEQRSGLIKKIVRSEHMLDDVRMERPMFITYLYMYQTLSDEELEQYVAFLESPAAKKFHDIAFKPFNQAMPEADGSVGQSVEKSREKSGEATHQPVVGEIPSTR